jgi:formylglycine-generating enzyme required for sulfatase activity
MEEPFKARIVAGDIPVGGSVVHIVDRVIVPPQFENNAIASQAYSEKDIKEFAMGGDAQFNARYLVKEMLEQAESLDDAGAIALYKTGLRMLEEVVPVNRRGVIMTMDDRAPDQRAVQRERLRVRAEELDRVWYAMFMKNSPAATTLSAPLSSTMPAARTVGMNAAPAAKAPATTVAVTTTAAPAAPAVPAATATRAPATLDWCEVIEKDVDAKVVTDAALRDAIAKTGLPWRVRDKASGIEMLLVPSGQFMMGKSAGDAEALANEVPAHSVTLTEPYYLGRYEVTREQWTKVMGAGAKSGAERVQPGVESAEIEVGGGATIVVSGGVELVGQQGNKIVTRQTAVAGPDGAVTFTTTPAGDQPDPAQDSRSGLPIMAGWTKTADFCSKIGMRLPTEAEWEFACRAGAQTPRYGELDAIAWHRGNSDGRKQPVGTKAANALGFHDMIGNAWEWVNDWYGDYTRSAKTNPTGPASGTSRIARGSFFDFEDGFNRASRRYEMQVVESGGTGFRVARNP